jgi:hypothetical protein
VKLRIKAPAYARLRAARQRVKFNQEIVGKLKELLKKDDLWQRAG